MGLFVIVFCVVGFVMCLFVIGFNLIVDCFFIFSSIYVDCVYKGMCGEFMFYILV